MTIYNNFYWNFLVPIGNAIRFLICGVLLWLYFHVQIGNMQDMLFKRDPQVNFRAARLAFEYAWGSLWQTR